MDNTSLSRLNQLRKKQERVNDLRGAMMKLAIELDKGRYELNEFAKSIEGILSEFESSFHVEKGNYGELYGKLDSVLFKRTLAEDYIALHMKTLKEIAEDNKLWQMVEKSVYETFRCANSDCDANEDELCCLSIGDSRITMCYSCRMCGELEKCRRSEGLELEKKNSTLSDALREEEETYPETVNQVIRRISTSDKSSENCWRLLSAKKSKTYCLYCLVNHIKRERKVKNYCLIGHPDICLCQDHFTDDNIQWIIEDNTLFYLAKPFYYKLKVKPIETAPKSSFVRDIIPLFVLTEYNDDISLRAPCCMCDKKSGEWLLFGSYYLICNDCYMKR